MLNANAFENETLINSYLSSVWGQRGTSLDMRISYSSANDLTMYIY